MASIPILSPVGSRPTAVSSSRTLFNVVWNSTVGKLWSAGITAPDRNGETIQVDADYVKKHVGDLAKNADLSRFIL